MDLTVLESKNSRKSCYIWWFSLIFFLVSYTLFHHLNHFGFMLISLFPKFFMILMRVMRVFLSILNKSMYFKSNFRTGNCIFLINQIHKIFPVFGEYSILSSKLPPRSKLVLVNPQTTLWRQLLPTKKLKSWKAQIICREIRAKMGQNSPKLEIDGSKTKERSRSVNKSWNYRFRLIKTHIYLGVIPENISLIGQKSWILLQF